MSKTEKATVTERRWATYDVDGPSKLRVQLSADRSRVLIGATQRGDSDIRGALLLTGPEWKALCGLWYSIEPDEPVATEPVPGPSMTSSVVLAPPVSAPIPTDDERLAAAERQPF